MPEPLIFPVLGVLPLGPVSHVTKITLITYVKWTANTATLFKKKNKIQKQKIVYICLYITGSKYITKISVTLKTFGNTQRIYQHWIEFAWLCSFCNLSKRLVLPGRSMRYEGILQSNWTKFCIRHSSVLGEMHFIQSHFAVLIVSSTRLNLNPFADASTRNSVLRAHVNLKWYRTLQNKCYLLDLLLIMECLETLTKKEIHYSVLECTGIKYKLY